MSRTNNIYFSADYHIGHENVLHLDGRPFQDMDSMCRGLTKRFNAQVRDQDVCYFLGDMGQGPKLKEFMEGLNGTKVLILGNHDSKRQSMMNKGFDVVLNSGSLVIQGELVTFTHCPLRGVFREDTSDMRGTVEGDNWHKESLYTDFSIEDHGQFHLHGHIHSPNGGMSERILGRQYDVGLPGNNYIPVSMSTIESWIVKTKREEEND